MAPSSKSGLISLLAKGEWLAAYALTELEAGSDARSMRTSSVMATELEAARLLVYRAAVLIDRSQSEPDLRFSQESAMAKMYASH